MITVLVICPIKLTVFFFLTTAINYDSRLYAVGGRDGSVCLRTVECYDPYTNKWLPCAPMAKQRGGVGLAAFNGCLYACGGHDAPASHPCAARLDCCERQVNMLTNSVILRMVVE